MTRTRSSLITKVLALLFYFLLVVIVARAQVTSSFDVAANTNDGWTIFNASSGSSSAAFYSSTGGNPATGGYINDGGTSTGPIIFYAEAPGKFHGNFSLSYKQNLTFDLKQSTAGTDNTNGDIILTNSTIGITLYYQLPSKPATTAFSSYSVKLDETFAGWHFGSPTGVAPTQIQMKQVLNNITSLRIRTKYTTSNTFTVTGSLDNVVLNVASLPTPPTITSFSPASGLPGTSVTITGTNFNSLASKNVVYFNGTSATVTSATPTQLIVTSPARITYGPITVINTVTGAQGTSRANFNPLFDNNKDFGGRVIASSFGKYVGFGTPPSFSVGMTGFSIGDLDGDGWQDVVTSRNDAGNMYAQVYRNAQQTGGISAASFASPITLSLPNSPTSGAVVRVAQTGIADLDNDGKLDVIVSVGYNLGGNDDNSFIIFLNQSTPGSLSFASGYIFQVPVAVNNNQAMAIADMDGDGRPELFLSLQNSASRLGIMQNLSTPGNLDFAYPIDVSQGQTFGVDISLGDLNGDSKPEIILEAYLSGAIYVYENTSTPGNISVGVPFQISTSTTAKIKVVDLDGDGNNDLFFKDYAAGGNVRIKKNNHTSGALTAADFSPDVLISQQLAGVGSTYAYAEAADVNGDNKVDIIMGDGTNIAVYQNIYTSGPLSASSFYAGTTFEGGNNSNQYLLTADIDGDNKPEILIRPQSGAAFWVYHNESFPAPRIDTITPSSGVVGASVTFGGDHFSSGIGFPPVVGRLGKIATTIVPSSNTAASALVTPSISGRFSFTEHGLTSFSKRFDVLFGTTQVFNSSSFGPSIDFPLAANLRDALDVADFDDDGGVDVAVIDNFSTAKIFKNSQVTPGQAITSGSLTVQTTTYSAGYNLLVLDIDGDGKTDLNSGTGLLQNTSSGTISFATSVGSAASGFTASSSADFNKDGKIDLVFTGGNIQVYENLSRNGAFTSNSSLFQNFGGGAVNLTIPSTSTGVVAADFDNDGLDDIISVNSSTNNSTYYLNNNIAGGISTTSFSFLGNYSVSGLQPYDVTANDFDGDGKTDIAITYYNSAFVSVLLNNSSLGDISFIGTDVPVANKGYKITSQDLDGDGKVEIVVIHQPNPGPGSFTVLQNKCSVGLVSFTATNFSINRNPQAVNIADINGDKKPDILIVASGGSTAPVNALMVFENKIASPTITVTTQPASVYSVCDGATPVISTAATGTTNISYQWQIFNSGSGVFVDLTNTGGYANVSTSSFTINSTGNFGAGTYRCKINGDFAATVYSNTVSFSINPIPPTPVTSNVSNCGPGSLVLSASGTTNGNYMWYDTNGLIAGQTNSAYTTPVISSTSFYSVRITDGTCVSPQVSITATINTVPAAPATSNVSNCGATAFTLTASGASNGNYLWYDINGVIGGQVNNAYVTPVISTTTGYSVAITNGLCNSAKTNITATINAVPSAPTTQGASQCSGSTFSLTASGGTNGQYVWYTAASGGSGISGQANSTYVTPALTVNTTYFVSINNGFCESARTPVVATVITSGCSVPVITPAPLATQVGGSVTLNLVSLITTSNNNLNVSSIVVTQQPASGAKASVSNGVLMVDYGGIAFSGSEQVTIQACDTDGNCTTQVFTITVAGDIIVYNGVSPNGNNPAFIIEYVSLIPETKNNTVYIFDRWENLVWQGTNYDNQTVVFTGVSDSGKDLPSGVYYYKINFASGRKTETGFISLRRQ